MLWIHGQALLAHMFRFRLSLGYLLGRQMLSMQVISRSWGMQAFNFYRGDFFFSFRDSEFRSECGGIATTMYTSFQLLRVEALISVQFSVIPDISWAIPESGGQIGSVLNPSPLHVLCALASSCHIPSLLHLPSFSRNY